VDKIQALDNFYEIDGYNYPKESQGLTEVFADQGSGSTDRDNAEYMKRRRAAKKAASSLPGSLSKSDYMPGATVKNPNSSCKRCHGRGTLWKAPDGTILPANDVPGAKRYKCGACDGIGMVKQDLSENAEDLHIGDPVIITGNGIEFEGSTGEIIDFGQQHRFVVVDLYNHGKHSFHSSDVSFNEYAGSNDEEARMYDTGEFGDDYRDEMDEAEEPMQSPEQIAYNQLRAQWDGYQFMTSGGGNTYVSRDPAHAAKLATIPAQLAKMAAALKAKGIDAEAEYNDIGGPKAAPVDINQKYVDEVRMSAAQRLSNAWDRQRAKSDASLRRTPSSIPKKEEPKKADTGTKTVSEHRARRQELMAQMLTGR
jgi:hypothetical protein